MPPRPSSRDRIHLPRRSPIMRVASRGDSGCLQHTAGPLSFPGEAPRMRTALVLIAHGSRHPAANDDLHDLAARLRERGGYEPVVASFLALAEPAILTAG